MHCLKISHFSIFCSICYQTESFFFFLIRQNLNGLVFFCLFVCLTNPETLVVIQINILTKWIKRKVILDIIYACMQNGLGSTWLRSSPAVVVNMGANPCIKGILQNPQCKNLSHCIFFIIRQLKSSLRASKNKGNRISFDCRAVKLFYQ